MDKPKILIVDDDPDLRRGLNLRLRANDYETAFATDGVSAIAIAQKERPSLIILDLGLACRRWVLGLGAIAAERPPCQHPGDRFDRIGPAAHPRASHESGGHRFFPKASEQRRTAQRNSYHSAPLIGRVDNSGDFEVSVPQELYLATDEIIVDIYEILPAV